MIERTLISSDTFIGEHPNRILDTLCPLCPENGPKNNCLCAAQNPVDE